MRSEEPANPFVGIPCRECGSASLRLEYREETYDVRPLGTWSLSGAQMKVSAHATSWPWCVCGDCGAASRGKAATMTP